MQAEARNIIFPKKCESTYSLPYRSKFITKIIRSF